MNPRQPKQKVVDIANPNEQLDVTHSNSKTVLQQIGTIRDKIKAVIEKEKISELFAELSSEILPKLKTPMSEDKIKTTKQVLIRFLLDIWNELYKNPAKPSNEIIEEILNKVPPNSKRRFNFFKKFLQDSANYLSPFANIYSFLNTYHSKLNEIYKVMYHQTIEILRKWKLTDGKHDEYIMKRKRFKENEKIAIRYLVQLRDGTFNIPSKEMEIFLQELDDSHKELTKCMHLAKIQLDGFYAELKAYENNVVHANSITYKQHDFLLKLIPKSNDSVIEKTNSGTLDLFYNNLCDLVRNQNNNVFEKYSKIKKSLGVYNNEYQQFEGNDVSNQLHDLPASTDIKEAPARNPVERQHRKKSRESIQPTRTSRAPISTPPKSINAQFAPDLEKKLKEDNIADLERLRCKIPDNYPVFKLFLESQINIYIDISIANVSASKHDIKQAETIRSRILELKDLLESDVHTKYLLEPNVYTNSKYLNKRFNLYVCNISTEYQLLLDDLQFISKINAFKTLKAFINKNREAIYKYIELKFHREKLDNPQLSLKKFYSNLKFNIELLESENFIGQIDILQKEINNIKSANVKDQGQPLINQLTEPKANSPEDLQQDLTPTDLVIERMTNDMKAKLEQTQNGFNTTKTIYDEKRNSQVNSPRELNSFISGNSPYIPIDPDPIELDDVDPAVKSAQEKYDAARTHLNNLMREPGLNEMLLNQRIDLPINRDHFNNDLEYQQEVRLMESLGAARKARAEALENLRRANDQFKLRKDAISDLAKATLDKMNVSLGELKNQQKYLDEKKIHKREAIVNERINARKECLNKFEYFSQHFTKFQGLLESKLQYVNNTKLNKSPFYLQKYFNELNKNFNLKMKEIEDKIIGLRDNFLAQKKLIENSKKGGSDELSTEAIKHHLDEFALKLKTLLKQCAEYYKEWEVNNVKLQVENRWINELTVRGLNTLKDLNDRNENILSQINKYSEIVNKNVDPSQAPLTSLHLHNLKDYYSVINNDCHQLNDQILSCKQRIASYYNNKIAIKGNNEKLDGDVNNKEFDAINKEIQRLQKMYDKLEEKNAVLIDTNNSSLEYFTSEYGQVYNLDNLQIFEQQSQLENACSTIYKDLNTYITYIEEIEPNIAKNISAVIKSYEESPKKPKDRVTFLDNTNAQIASWQTPVKHSDQAPKHHGYTCLEKLQAHIDTKNVDKLTKFYKNSSIFTDNSIPIPIPPPKPPTLWERAGKFWDTNRDYILGGLAIAGGIAAVVGAIFIPPVAVAVAVGAIGGALILSGGAITAIKAVEDITNSPPPPLPPRKSTHAKVISESPPAVKEDKEELKQNQTNEPPSNFADDIIFPKPVEPVEKVEQKSMVCSTPPSPR